MIKSIHMLAITILGTLSAMIYAYIGIDTQWLFYTLMMYFLFSCLGITITFHRYLTHRSFRFKWKWMEKLFLLFGSLAGTGSAIGWVAVHKSHHAHSDTEKDPHGPMTGWRNFFNDYDDDVDYRSVKHLLRDPYLRTLHKYGLWILLMFYSLLFTIGGLQAVVFFGLLPQMFTIIISASCNYFAHLYGYQSYETGDDSRNTWWLAVPTWGDSWHNNHHAKPNLYSFRHKWWEFDISGSIISLVREKDVR